MGKILTKEKLDSLIKTPDIDIFVFDSLESTNKTAKELAVKEKINTALVVAKEQTSGRGRLGRTFFSPKGGVYFSLLLKPKFTPQISLKITTAAAVAVARVIEKMSGKEAKIKWVNDIFVCGKKVCGILAEGVFCGLDKHPDYVVLGIGANLTPPKDGFPKEIESIAGSIFGYENTEDLRAEFISLTVDEFFDIYKQLPHIGYNDEYKERSFLIGREISFVKEGLETKATVKDIDGEFRLVVETSKGERQYLSAGEVTIGSKNV